MAGSLFISYSRADMDEIDWIGRLKTYLAPLRRNHAVDIWDDSRLAAGAEWRQEINAALQRATANVDLLDRERLMGHVSTRTQFSYTPQNLVRLRDAVNQVF